MQDFIRGFKDSIDLGRKIGLTVLAIGFVGLAGLSVVGAIFAGAMLPDMLEEIWG